MKKSVVAAIAVLFQAGISFGQNAVTSGSSTSHSGTSSGVKKTDDEMVVVTVTKNAQVASKVGSAFSKLGGEEISDNQQTDLGQALNTMPGVVFIGAGARGSTPTLSIRGNRTSDTLLLVDGVQVNTGMQQDAKPFLAYAGTENLSSIDVVRGPQSTLYGSQGIGGVVAMDTLGGTGKPTTTLFSEAGNFNTFREGINSSGAVGKGAYSVSYERNDTSNDRPNNDLSMNRYSMRLDYQPSDDLSLRLNFRGNTGYYQEPGSNRPQDWASNDPSAYSQSESNLVSAIAIWKVMPQWTQKLTLGGYFERYSFIDPPYAGNSVTFFGTVYSYPTYYISNAANYNADWQNTVEITHNNRATVGLGMNYFTGHDNTFSNQGEKDFNTYLQDEWEVVKNLNLTGGVRYDHYDLAGDAVTYRITAAYLFDKSDTKIRSSYGTAFKAPSMLELFSTDIGFLGNPNLKPETSKGWDAGVDQYLLNRRVTLSATYFQNRLRNVIAWVDNGYPNGSYINRDSAQNNGVELGAVATIQGDWKSRIAYTYTQSTYTASGVTLKRDIIPTNNFSLETSDLFFGKWLVGGGISYLAGRVDSEQGSYKPPIGLDNYCTVRMFTRYEVNNHLAVYARVENLNNAVYQTSLGRPGLPLNAIAGVEVKF